jgi:Ser/Thr protein kinase RdoA (MazF antagonist)
LLEYDLPPISELRAIRFTNNAVYEVTAGGRFALRVHRTEYRTAAEIRSELTFLRAIREQLSGTRVDVPQPVPTRGGDLVAEGERCCDLLTWVPGRTLRPTRGLGPRAGVLLGEGLARLHEAAIRFEPPSDFELPSWDGDTLFSASSPFRPGEMEAFLPTDAWRVFAEVAARTRSVLAQLPQTPDWWGILHADFVLVNCRFARRRRGWELGIIDFDDMGWGHFVYDLAGILGNFADFPESYPRLRRAFLSGYRSIRPMPRALEEHLPVLMAARHASVLTWLAGLGRRGEADLDVPRFVEYRVQAMRHCLTLR